MSKKIKIEDFTKKNIQEIGLEKPSDDFVLAIMNEVNALNVSSKKIVYKPIISNKTWFVLGVIFTTICSYLVLNNSENITGKYSAIFESYLDKVHSFYNPFATINYSSTFVVCFAVFMIFGFIQLYSILKYHNKSQIKSTASEY